MAAADVAVYVACWQPVSVPPQAACFARSVVELAAPPTRARANALLWAAARLAACAVPLGGPGAGGAAAPVGDRAVRGQRAGAVRLGAPHAADQPAVHRPPRGPGAGTSGSPLPRERARAPYSAGEIDGYLALADAQPTLARRMRAAGLVAWAPAPA